MSCADLRAQAETPRAQADDMLTAVHAASMFASRQSTRLWPSLQLLLLVPQAAGNVPGASDGKSALQLSFCCCVHPLEAATGAAKGESICACRVLHMRLADRCPPGNLENQVKHHQFNLKLTYKASYIAT